MAEGFRPTRPAPRSEPVKPLDEKSAHPKLGLDPIPSEELRAATTYLLDSTRDLLDQHVYFGTPGAVDYLAAFVLATYVVNAGLQAPYVALLSSAPQAGKSLTLDLLAATSRYGMLLAAGSGAALARVLEEKPHRTLLVDEFDRKMAGGDKMDENLVEVVNGGIYPTGVKVVADQKGKTYKLRLFGPKVLAGIDNGRWVPAVLDRCVVIRMDRMPRGETRTKANLSMMEPELEALRHDMARWQRGAVAQIAAMAAKPTGLTFLSHRLEAGAALPVAVAEMAGDEWRQRVVEALRALQADRPAEVEDQRIRLVLDLRGAFEECESDGRASTGDLCDFLNREENLPYGGWNHGEGITSRELLRVLRAFDPAIKSRPTHIAGRSTRALDRADLLPVWERFGAPSLSSCGRSSRSSVADEPEDEAGQDTFDSLLGDDE